MPMMIDVFKVAAANPLSHRNRQRVGGQTQTSHDSTRDAQRRLPFHLATSGGGPPGRLRRKRTKRGSPLAVRPLNR
jgi:hypothetical protein